MPCLGAWGQRSRGLGLEQEGPGSQRGEGSLCLSFCRFSWIKFPSRFCLSIFHRPCYSLTHHVPDQPLDPSAFPAQVASADRFFVLWPQFTSLWGGSRTASLSPCASVATPWAPVVGGVWVLRVGLAPAHLPFLGLEQLQTGLLPGTLMRGASCRG